MCKQTEHSSGKVVRGSIYHTHWCSGHLLIFSNGTYKVPASFREVSYAFIEPKSWKTQTLRLVLWEDHPASWSMSNGIRAYVIWSDPMSYIRHYISILLGTGNCHTRIYGFTVVWKYCGCLYSVIYMKDHSQSLWQLTSISEPCSWTRQLCIVEGNQPGSKWIQF